MELLFDRIIKTRNNKILGLARNYLKETIAAGSKDIPTFPMVFQKFWSNIVYEPNPIRLKKDRTVIHEGKFFLNEVELGLIIGKTATDIRKENYLDYIHSYFLLLDLTDPIQLQNVRQDKYPFFLSKGHDYFLPISRLIEKKVVNDPHNLRLNLWINKELKQSDNTANMYFNIPDTLEFISKYSTLHPGDMILTGTPIGLGPVKIEDQLYANIEQEGKVIMDMRFNVEEDK